MKANRPSSNVPGFPIHARSGIEKRIRKQGGDFEVLGACSGCHSQEGRNSRDKSTVVEVDKDDAAPEHDKVHVGGGRYRPPPLRG